MSDDVLSVIEGYDQALLDKAKLAAKGTDFTERKGEVAAIIGHLHPKRLSLRVIKVIEETVSTKTLRLEAVGGYLPPFQAGQYINLFVNIEGVNTSRPYAISSSPFERNYYDVTIRRVIEGFVSNYLLDQVHAGMCLQSTGPMGTFYYNPIFHGDDLIFLAGGSGIAPAMSIILDIIHQKRPVRFHLIYGSRNMDDIIFHRELKQLEAENDFLTVTRVISEPSMNYSGKKGFVSTELISELVGSLDDKMFYLCGPSNMYDFCLVELKNSGVPSRKIRVEMNGAPKLPEQLEGWPVGVLSKTIINVTVRGKGRFSAKVGEPLINSLERNGYFVENACRTGECSLCRIKVLSGNVFNAPQARIRFSDRQFGWCHACSAYPVEDIEILI
ncbi:MAG: flavodoxin reductase [Alphaproteobacteria bacterium]|nr:MAG: flavodoxin reductase [Alphaproteobacteria bacterium]